MSQVIGSTESQSGGQNQGDSQVQGGQFQGGRRGQLKSSGLRPGWTTGACATAAAKAAFVALQTGEFPDPVIVALPHGRTPSFALTRESLSEGRATVAITKDAGDDPDVTHCAVVSVTIAFGEPGSGVTFVAGEGVGTITLPGLPLEVGEPAINPKPREMIIANLSAAARELGHENCGDLVVTVSIEKGSELAAHTLNPRLGVVGGLSVLGTTGVVIPYSCSAWIDSIRRGVDVARASGLTHLAAATGSTSTKIAMEHFRLPELAMIDMGDFVGAVLKYLRKHPVERLSLVGGIGKFSKLADGHLDLHSGRSQVDKEFLAQLAIKAGANNELAGKVRESNTALQAVNICAESGIELAGMIAQRARDQAIEVLKSVPIDIDVVCIDRAGIILAET